METPRRADLARLDRKRNKRKSNQDWKSRRMVMRAP
jgi:hypothetical protein